MDINRERLFWDWHDALLFIGLIVPCGFLALAVARGAFFLAGKPNQAAFLLLFMFTGYALWLTALYGLLHFRYGRPFWASLGCTFPWPRMGLTLVLGPALAIGVALGAVILRTPSGGSALQALMSDRLSIVLVGLFSTTLGPLCEELVFRGFFQPLLVGKFGAHLGVLLCAAPFALLHGPQYNWSWQIVLLLVLAGVVFGYTRLLTGSTAASTLVHATYNLTYFTGYLLQNKDLYF